MGFFDDNFLLGMFDFNFDKKLSSFEKFSRDMYIAEQARKLFENDEKPSDSGFDWDDYDDNEPDYTKERLLSYGYDETDLDEMGYEFMDEFDREVLADEAEEKELSCIAPVSVSMEFDSDDEDEFSKIKREDYHNKRSYDATLHLYNVTHDTVGIYTEEQRVFEAEKCEFILNSDTLAAKYLTYDNGFILAQAIKDNFELPIDVPDEDNNRITFFDDLLTDIAEEDAVLATDIWVWCVKEFGPYLKYTDYDSEITNGILFNLDSYPQEFTDILVEKLDADDDFCRLLLTDTNDLAYCVSSLVAKALGDGNTETAKKIFSACTANPSLKSKMLESFVTELIRDCADWNDCEAMGLLSIHILPMMKEIDDKRHRRLLSKYEEEIYSYIDMMESDSEVCKYSKKYAWRNTCADGSEYGVSPKNFRTEEDYNRRLDAKKAARENQPNVDLKAESDKTVYSFCTVMFEHSQRQYIYLTGDNDIKIGDEVIVPVGEDNREVPATVVSTSQHMRLTAPYPVDKAKKILRKA